MKKDLIKLQRDFKALYGNGLVGVSDNYIQVTQALFTTLFSKSVNEVKLKEANNSIELRHEEDGVTFLTLL